MSRGCPAAEDESGIRVDGQYITVGQGHSLHVPPHHILRPVDQLLHCALLLRRSVHLCFAFPDTRPEKIELHIRVISQQRHGHR